MENDQKRAFLAVILSGLILFGWQYFYGPKTPTNNETVIPKIVKSDDSKVVQGTNFVDEKPLKQDNVENNVVEIKEFTLKNDLSEYIVNSNLSIKSAKNSNSVFSFFDIVGNDKPFSIYFDFGKGYSQQFFNLIQSDNSISFSNENLAGELILQENGKLKILMNSTTLKNISFEFLTSPKELENNQKREFIYLDDDLEAVKVGDSEKIDKAIRWFGINFNYHIFLLSFPQKTISLININEEGKLLSNVKFDKKMEFNFIFSKKEYDHLKTLGDNVHLSVDFGIWSLLAEPMLWLLQKFHTIIPNYGMAIILLTLLIRLLTFPLQYKSFKSMKKMQEIQPELTKLREKFKDDPQRMQKESMELFKRAGANPLGGCLPLMLQMPVFFALYKVLYSSVELVDAPFYFWIQDLSVKDPFYILPILMAAAMFVQQKLSPTTVADPTQKKVMMFMPLIFGLIMKDLPAGLCLYIFVSTVFGLVQQLYVYKRA